VSESSDGKPGVRVASQPGMNGVRAAMYAEMAKAANNSHPHIEYENDWDAALEAAICFIKHSGFDIKTKRQLICEAFLTQLAGDTQDWDLSAHKTCKQLAAGFRWQVRYQ
jgi:hypothetical protein